jgi:hypothetical protein
MFDEVDAANDVRVAAEAIGEHLDGMQGGTLGDAELAPRGAARHVGAVTIVVVGTAPARGEALAEPVPEVRMIGVDAGIEDVDVHALGAVARVVAAVEGEIALVAAVEPPGRTLLLCRAGRNALAPVALNEGHHRVRGDAAHGLFARTAAEAGEPAQGLHVGGLVAARQCLHGAAPRLRGLLEDDDPLVAHRLLHWYYTLQCNE